MPTVVLRERDDLSYTYEACLVEEDLVDGDEFTTEQLTVLDRCGHHHEPNSKRAAACVGRLVRALHGCGR